MKPLEVGEIGVLVYTLTEHHLRGLLVDVTGVDIPQNNVYYSGIICGHGKWVFAKDQLERITDPDQEQITEHQEVVTV